ncbi:20027_t:CDS:1, partial [Gigaspora margarita]
EIQHKKNSNGKQERLEKKEECENPTKANEKTLKNAKQNQLPTSNKELNITLKER